jgi:hypothetical protein
VTSLSSYLYEHITAPGQTSFCAVMKSVFVVVDDDAVGTESSQFSLVMPQKQTEDLEDWLDSMLDD